MEKFKKLEIIEPILCSIQEHGFDTPTEVQEKAIPFVIKGRDVIAGAATGSGKTLAFASGIIQNSEEQRVIQSLVLVPTRELAEQVADSLTMFSKYKKLRIVKVYGGVAISPQIQKLEKADVVVGTPGRILDHLNRKTIDLGFVKTLVLDEADRMLDMGFIKDVDRIISKCPKKRQTMLFSATLSVNILRLADKYLSNPIEINCESHVDPTKLTQFYYDVPDNMKFSLLVHLLKQEESELVMVFCNTQRNTDFVARNLQNIGVKALAIHGGISQDKRKKTLDSFHSKEVEVLVCTDVAARGLDIKDVSHVYNYDAPKEPEQYIHRIGRTARAGKKGKAIIILASRDYENFASLTNKFDLNIKKQELPDFERVFIKSKMSSDARRGNRSFSSSRYSGDRGDSGSPRGRFTRPRASSPSGGYGRDIEGEDRPSRGFGGGRDRGRFKTRGSSRFNRGRKPNSRRSFSKGRFPKPGRRSSGFRKRRD